MGLVMGSAIAATRDLTTLPIEQLLTLEVYSASKFPQKISEAPSAVTIITAADIKAYGYRTLADILRSIRGLYVTNDRNYMYLGARGFGRPGDYNSRILMLVDGYRINDNVYDGALVDTGFPVDVDLIERVEFVPGPGSAIYGNNAFFGVINVITRGGKDVQGLELSAETGNAGTRKGRVTYGRSNPDGLSYLLSATNFDSDGENLFYPEFDTPAQNNGVAVNLDHDRHQSLFTKISSGAFLFTGGHAERTKGIPTASYDQVFNDPRSHTVDMQTFANLQFEDDLVSGLNLLARLFYGRYEYRGDYVYDYPPVTLNRDETVGQWWGTEFKFMSHAWSGHKLVLGAEYQRDTRQEQSNFDVDPAAAYLDDRRHGSRAGVYVEDEISLRENLLLNAGLRHDRQTGVSGQNNPRLALVYRMTEPTTLKAIYGTAFRAPNTFERYYLANPGQYKLNPDLRPEEIATYELVLEHHLDSNSRLTLSAYDYRIDDLITLTTDPSDGTLVYQNLDKVEARGIELEAEQARGSGLRWRASYALQRAEDAISGMVLTNSPRHLAKLNLTAPLPATAWRGGLEWQYTDRRRTLSGGETSPYALTNLTLTSGQLAKGLEISASLYNLLDRTCADPGGEEHLQDVIPQDGRGWRMKLNYRY
ncbi:TonB-dependent receptor [Sulfuricaulis limicola]|uniref:TonB-dependent receptor n=1 Tax=Sulfuricaulis limicola TaxID=1620215 RepID=A0A1B4XI11_9GAMM|nr:TonB-dependent receptor [Sulfuricaulis limicola]BAV34437.1 TonB-dependent receptor [Sulfuricaulis limicola]